MIKKKFEEVLEEQKNLLKVEKCPICGAKPTLKTKDISRPDGVAAGCFAYYYICEFCGRVVGDGVDTISNSRDAAISKATKHWNTEVDTIKKFLDYKDSKNKQM